MVLLLFVSYKCIIITEAALHFGRFFVFRFCFDSCFNFWYLLEPTGCKAIGINELKNNQKYKVNENENMEQWKHVLVL